MNPTLGIGIPVYKRPEQLERCLRSCIHAARPFGVPIYVLDDSADDTNGSVVGALRVEYPHLHHIRNPSNLGIDRNILKSVDACPCRYVWLLGEDDRIVDDGVEQVLAALASEPDFLFVNYSTVDESVTRVLRKQAVALEADREEPAERFLAERGWAAGFLGGCVVNRERWSAIDSAPYIGTYFAHVGALFHSIRGGRVRMLARPLVLNRCGTPQTFTWQAVTFEVLSGWARLMTLLEPVYGVDICRHAREAFDRAHGLKTLRFLLYARAGCAYDVNAYRAYVAPSSGNRFYKAAAFAIACCNQRLVRGVYGMAARVRKMAAPRIERKGRHD